MRFKSQIVEEHNEDNELTLDELIPRYALNKTEADVYKKLCDRDNAKIKEIMLETGIHEKTTGEYKAICTVSKRETMNEDILISLFTSVPSFVSITEQYDIVKQKPYIDFDLLEKIIYEGVMTDEQLLDMNKAKEVKEVVTLRVTKKKDKEADD